MTNQFFLMICREQYRIQTIYETKQFAKHGVCRLQWGYTVRQAECTYNVTPKRIHVTIVAVGGGGGGGSNNVLDMCLYSWHSYSACNPPCFLCSITSPCVTCLAVSLLFFSTLSLIRHDFRGGGGGKLLNIWFSLRLFSETRRIKRDVINAQRSSFKVHATFVRF
jgi:hypothetical protein